jgi:integrase
MRKTLSDKGVAALKPRAARYATPDPELRGHYVRVQPSGTKSFVAVMVDPQSGKQIWHTIGAADAFGIDEARTKARAVIKRVRSGLPPVAAKGETFGQVAANWLQRHVEANGLRSRKNIQRLLDSHVLPEWKNRVFLDIRRSDVAALLDDVEDNHSPRQADAVLTVVRSIMNWFATRHDDYTPPIVRGMRRQNPHAQARARILDDREIRAIWKAAESCGSFGGIVRMALLTAQRRAKVAAMRWQDIVDGEWTIPT